MRDAEKRSLPVAWSLQGFDYSEAFDQAFWKTPDQEKHIRIRVWWLSNNAYRSCSATEKTVSSKEELQLSSEAEENLTRLLQLLDATDQDESVMKAEILRELA
jgi:hypothetical protein